ncbi:TIGR03084 family metal-binding protein [Nocardioides sp. LHG3406-4]|uniref:TIGR03084 family metal-binding protein n=1 Tax=Nocardioides sp. LHG3406-4 TaxID=2804575 RepID=UPI003CF711B5
MSAVIDTLVADLAAEQAELADFLSRQDVAAWEAPTPAVGWSVRDQVAHLAHFDAMTRLSIASPEEFVRFRDALPDLQTYVDGIGPANAHRSPAEMLQWWRDEAETVVAAAVAADPKARVPWFGPSMSLASKLTARLMETWAHGQDVYDALGATRRPTDRLRHVARIGVLAFPNSFRTRGLPVPDVPVLVDLAAPDGSTRWSWGDPAARDVVRGPALDFCLVVTQRRHPDDVDLEVRGEVAEQWMAVAQAFAGPAGAGRLPGQFPVEAEAGK